MFKFRVEVYLLLLMTWLTLLICEIKIRSHARNVWQTTLVRYVGVIIWSGSTTYPRNGIFTLKGNKGLNKTREYCQLWQNLLRTGWISGTQGRPCYPRSLPGLCRSEMQTRVHTREGLTLTDLLYICIKLYLYYTPVLHLEQDSIKRKLQRPTKGRNWTLEFYQESVWC